MPTGKSVVKKGKIKRIHVNKHIVASNLKHGKNDPVITVKCGKENIYGHRVKILGPSELVHATEESGIKPLSCGARLWVETISEVEIQK